MPLLIGRLYPFGLWFVCVVPCKGVHPYVVERLAKFLNEAGLVQFAYRSDKEPSSVEEVDAIGKKIMEILEKRKFDLYSSSSAGPPSGPDVAGMHVDEDEKDKVAFAEKALDETAMKEAKKQQVQERSAIGVDVVGNRVL